jgi:hypothetical protein
MFFYNNREVSAQTTPCQTQSFTPLAVNKGEHKFLRVLICRAEFLLQTTINTYSALHTELFVCLNYSPLMRIIYGSQRQDTPRNTPHNGVHINKQTHKPTCKSSLLPCSNITFAPRCEILFVRQSNILMSIYSSLSASVNFGGGEGAQSRK